MRIHRALLVLFVVVTLLSGWIGVAVNRLLGEPSGIESPGAGIWLVLPMLTAGILALFGFGDWKSGIRPRLRGNLGAYGVALGLYPAVTATTLGIGAAVGAVDLSRLDLPRLLALAAVGFLPNILKNVFEESTWRIALTGELLRGRLPDLALYGIVGGVWGLWHLPYYLVLLPEEMLRQVIDAPPAAMAAIAVAVMLCWGVAYTELYRLTGSVWPCVLMHAVEDVTVNPIVVEGMARFPSGAQGLFSPIVGAVSAAGMVAAGLGMRAVRRRRERAEGGAAPERRRRIGRGIGGSAPASA